MCNSVYINVRVIPVNMTIIRIRDSRGCVNFAFIAMFFLNMLDVDNFQLLTWSDPDFIGDSELVCAILGGCDPIEG